MILTNLQKGWEGSEKEKEKKKQNKHRKKQPRFVSLLESQNVTYKQGILHKILSNSNADWENL